MSRVHGSQFTGTCKFWNAVQGYGFLTADDGGPDLFVSQHDLVTGDGGFRALTAGTRVECTYTMGDQGKPIGKNITGIGGTPVKSFKDMYTAKRMIEQTKPPDPNKKYGTIKWFNQPKSFGFIVPSDGGADLFFHYSECLKGIIPAEGDQVEYATKEDKGGKIIGAKVKNKTQKGGGGGGGGGADPRPMAAHPAMPAYAAHPAYPGYPPAQAAGPVSSFAAFGKKTGVVKFFDEGKGYGFIVPDHGGRDIHVHKSNVMGGELVKDEAVEYEEQAINGKVQAVSVSRSTGAKRGGGEQAAYATKRPRVMYDMQPGGGQGSYGQAQEYQYFDPHAAPTYY